MPNVATTQWVCRYDAGIPGKEWRRLGSADVPVGSLGGYTPPASAALFAGHVPNRVLIGMATPAGNPPPGWNEARTIIGQPIYEARRFTGSWVSESEFNSMVGEADAANSLANISFKVPGGSNGAGWGAVRDGTHDAGLLNLFSYFQNYNKNIICSFEHEPAGTGITNTDLGIWAQMQTRMAYYFAGYRGATWSGGTLTLGTYNAAHDLSLNNNGKVSWGPVGNGFWWRSMSNATLLGNRNAAFPAHLIQALNNTKGILQNDFYDTDYSNQTAALTDPAFRTVGSGVRTSTRIQNYIGWARANSVNMSGCGEYGCIDGADMLATWAVMRANRDIWGLANYFNSLANSDHDWRLVPSNYPVTNPQYTSDKGFVDFGGNAQSQGRLDAFKTTLTESISLTYTGAL